MTDEVYPDEFSELVRTHPKKPGKPFEFKNREFLRPVYREFHPSIKEKVVIYFGSRKIEKTEFILNVILYAMTIGFFPWNILYTIARRKQVRTFSVKRLIPAINTSVAGCLKEKYMTYPTGVHSRQFFTDMEGVYNHISLESSWNLAKGILGEESQMVVSDESQDQEKGFFAMLNEMMTQSDYKWFIITGTARDPLSELAVFWKQSTQNLWTIMCQNCAKEQIFTKKNEDGTIEYKAMGVQNLFRQLRCDECGKNHLRQGWRATETIHCDCGKIFTKEHATKLYKGCAWCRKPLDVRKGEWKTYNPGAIYIGYHANQLMHPVITAKAIYEKLISPGYPRAQFINEVLGEFFGGEGSAVRIEDVLACRRDSYDYITQSDKENNLMGVDTGKPNYVSIIDGNNDRILFQDSIEFKNTAKRKEYFIRLMDRFSIKQCVIDYGDTGRDLGKDLQEEFGDRVKTCFYTSRPGNWYQYKIKDGLGNRVYRITVDKTIACTEVVNKFQSRSYKIPFGTQKSQDKAEETFKHYVNIIWEKPDEHKPTSGTPQTKIGNAGPDHYFHTLVYCYIAGVNKQVNVQVAVVGELKRKRGIESSYYNKIQSLRGLR